MEKPVADFSFMGKSVFFVMVLNLLFRIRESNDQKSLIRHFLEVRQLVNPLTSALQLQAKNMIRMSTVFL